ncbi:MAG: HDIG domain-containing metalloprotein [Syntrophales bacterium]
MQKNGTALKVKGTPAQREIPLFLKNPALQKWSILVVLSVILTLLLIPRFHFFSPVYSVGMVLEKDVIADRDFVVKDRAATEQRKTEAERNLEPVYDYDREFPANLAGQISRAFSQVRERHYRRDDTGETRARDLRKVRADLERALGVPISGANFQYLHRRAFSSDVENSLNQFLQIVYRADFVRHDEYVKWSKKKGIITRDLKTQREEERRNLTNVIDMEDLDYYLEKQSISFFGREKEEQRIFAFTFLRGLVQPNLTFNRDATEKRKQSLIENFQPLYFRIQKNEVIARAGESLTPETLNKLDVYFGRKDSPRAHEAFFGILFTIMILCAVFYNISRGLAKNIEKSIVDVLFLSSLALLQVILVRAGIFFSDSISHAFPYIQADAVYYALPFTFATWMVAVFMNRNVALVFSVFSAVLMTFLFEAKMTMFLFAFLGSSVSAYHMSAYGKHRSSYFRSGVLAGLVNMTVIISISLLSGKFAQTDIFFKLLMGMAGGVLSGILVAGVIPLFESLFGYTTDVRLLELANLDQPILQRMIVEAPGTYHHSIIVASMAEAAAEAIHANSLLAKVAAYYHDIGKTSKPLYFIENQQGWKNKHDKLSPRMSSLVIISHVKDGCEIAQKHRLGRVLTDIIRQHHGMGIVSYFYEKAQKDKDPSIRSIPESDFRYPGPKPQTKEAGIVMLGDVVEASSRTLTEPTPSRIRNLVQGRIKQVFMDGQLDECELTMADLNGIADSFTRTLTGIFHHRIDYNVSQGVSQAVPKKEGNGGPKKEGNGGHPDNRPAEKGKGR